MQTFKPNKRSPWPGTLSMVLAIAAILLSTAGVAAAFDNWNSRIRTEGVLVSSDQAGQANVFELVSGERVFYYHVSRVFDNSNRLALNRVPFNRIRVIGSQDALEKLAMTKTCKPLELDMSFYRASSTAAFMRVSKLSADSWAAADMPDKTCG